MKTVVMENMCCGWLDKDTFRLVFDGEIDEDGDYFFYCCEYWEDVDQWHFQRIYEDDYTNAGFTAEQIEMVKSVMENLMIDKRSI